MEALGVDRNTKGRALKQFQESGLISVRQDPGKLPVVTLLYDDRVTTLEVPFIFSNNQIAT